MNDYWNPILILGTASILGGAIGLERELRGGWAGLRTHMMVSLAAAVFMVTGMEAGGATAADLSRIIQGVAAGIGFIGAGTILKLTNRLEVKGLTTASSIWLAAAVGAACGIRHYFLAALAATFSVVILFAIGKFESHFPARAKYHEPAPRPEDDTALRESSPHEHR